ncbi:MAG: transcription termination/antitermination NusG family protein [Planctomycetota bacterium]|nr:transcription termination/antitermination NusG family protein [Planctomycetota bacterium]
MSGTTWERFDRLPPPEVRKMDGSWLVAHTLPRQEKALGDALVAAGVSCFVPTVGRVRFYGHRKRRVELPLFPSYVFVHGSRDDALVAARTKRVAQILPVADQAQLEYELRQLDVALSGDAPLDVYPYLAVGRRVVVRSGPFQGLEGVIDERRGEDRLVLNVSLLGRSTDLEIDASLLEPIDSSA